MKSFLNRFSKYETETNADGNSHFASNTALPNSALYSAPITKSQKILIMAMFLMGMALLLTILLMVHSQTRQEGQFASSETTQAQTILNQLNDLHAQLNYLSAHAPRSADVNQTLLTMGREISAMKSSVNSLATQNEVQTIASQLTAVKSDIDGQLLNVKRMIAGGKDNKNFVDASVLPFSVISIDVISQQPFASINYDHHITPLTVGDSVAGWQIVAADYADSWVEFKNDRGQYVKVALQG